MNDSTPRYAPDREFPPYAYLPGEHPHPKQDPRGHSYGSEEPPASYSPASAWAVNSDYLYGCDLYNHGYLWEAHEAWEGIWHPSKHDRTQAEFLQGLIQCTAATLKIPMQQPRGLERLTEAGTARLERVGREQDPYMGLQVLDFVRSFRAFAGGAPTETDARPLLILE